MTKRGLTNIFLTASLWTICTVAGATEPSFIEKCTGQTDLAKAKISCTVEIDGGKSVMNLELNKGEYMYVKSNGRFGHSYTYMRLSKVQHLPPRLSEIGVIGESVRFVATDGMQTATLSLLCESRGVGILSFGSNNDRQGPLENFAHCTVAQQN